MKAPIILAAVALAITGFVASARQPDKTTAARMAPATQSGGMGKLRFFNGNDCVTGNGNCLPDVIVTPKLFDLHARALEAFDQAVKSGTTAEYFTSDRWVYLFPSLRSRPEQLKTLQAGIPIIRLPGRKNVLHYLATKLSLEELRSRIAMNKKGLPIAGIEVCIPILID